MDPCHFKILQFIDSFTASQHFMLVILKYQEQLLLEVFVQLKQMDMHGDGWLREGLWPSHCPENHPVNKTGGSGQENKMFFDGIQATEAPG